MTSKFLEIASLCFLSLFFLASVGYGHQQAVIIPLSSSKPAVVDFVGGYLTQGLTSSDQTIISLTLDVPSRGIVIVNASGYFSWQVVDRTSAARCSITQDTSITFVHLMIAGGETTVNLGAEYIPFAGTRAFHVKKGLRTFNLVCDSYSAADNDIYVNSVHMNAIYYFMPQ